jgi:sugar (pentulose or hexulose) kinase
VITLGIDIGTTHTKALALDVETSRTLALEAVPTPVNKDADGEVRRAGDVLDVVVGLIAAITSSLPDDREVAALSVASVGEEVVLLDAAGQPVGNTIVWHDSRGTDEADAYLSGPGGEVELSQRWPPDATFSLFKLMWLRDHRPADLVAASTWTDLGDYVLHGLGADVVMDWTHASRAGAFDLTARAWDQGSIHAAGLAIAFPSLVPSGTEIGTLSPQIAEQVGLSTGVRLVAGGHDHLCAAFGAGVHTTSDLLLSAGTSEAHLALLDSPVVDNAGRYHLDQGCFVDGERYYAHVNLHAGHFFRQWRELLYSGVADEAMYAELEAAGDLAAGPRFEVLEGLRTARLDAIPYSAGRAVLMRAVLEGLADRSADIVAFLEEASGRRLDRIIAVGHPPQVPLWRELRQGRYGRPVVVADQPEMTAYGAALMAAGAV